MEQFEFEMQRQIGFEMSRKGYSNLFEKLGYPEKVLEFTRGFVDKIIDQIRKTSSGNKTSVEYTENDFESCIPFVEKYRITVNVKIKNGDDCSEGGFNGKDSKIYIKNGLMFLYPVVDVDVYGDSRIELKNNLFSVI